MRENFVRTSRSRRPTIRAHREALLQGEPVTSALAHFLAGEQALIEALVLSQAALPALDAGERDPSVTEFSVIIRTIAQNEVGAFCSLGQRHPISATAEVQPSNSNSRLHAQSSHDLPLT
jgi:hypothetical protein